MLCLCGYNTAAVQLYSWSGSLDTLAIKKKKKHLMAHTKKLNLKIIAKLQVVE